MGNYLNYNKNMKVLFLITILFFASTWASEPNPSDCEIDLCMNTCMSYDEECDGEECVDAFDEAVVCYLTDDDCVDYSEELADWHTEEEWDWANDGEHEPITDELLATLTSCITNCFTEDDAFSTAFESFQECM